MKKICQRRHQITDHLLVSNFFFWLVLKCRSAIIVLYRRAKDAHLKSLGFFFGVGGLYHFAGDSLKEIQIFSPPNSTKQADT